VCINDLLFKVDYDDVDHATVDAMTDTMVEVLKKNWDSVLFLANQKKYQKKRWKEDEDLREEYDNNFEKYFKENFK